MAGKNNLDTHFGGTLHDSIKIFYLEPEQYTIAIGFVVTIANRAMMVLHFKAVQLENKLSIFRQLLILLAAVAAATIEKALIPAAAGFDIRDTNQRLRTHGYKTTKAPGTFA